MVKNPGSVAKLSDPGKDINSPSVNLLVIKWGLRIGPLCTPVRVLGRVLHGTWHVVNEYGREGGSCLSSCKPAPEQ